MEFQYINMTAAIELAVVCSVCRYIFSTQFSICSFLRTQRGILVRISNQESTMDGWRNTYSEQFLHKIVWPCQTAAPRWTLMAAPSALIL